MASNSKANSEVSNTLFSGVKSIIRRRATPWVGTMTDLDSAVSRALMNTKNGVPINWPASPSALRVALNIVVNRLRNAGVSIRFVRSSDYTRTRLVEFYNNR